MAGRPIDGRSVEKDVQHHSLGLAAFVFELRVGYKWKPLICRCDTVWHPLSVGLNCPIRLQQPDPPPPVPTILTAATAVSQTPQTGASLDTQGSGVPAAGPQGTGRRHSWSTSVSIPPQFAGADTFYCSAGSAVMQFCCQLLCPFPYQVFPEVQRINHLCLLPIRLPCREMNHATRFFTRSRRKLVRCASN